MSNKILKYIIFVVSVSILVFVDQYTKFLASINLKDKAPKVLIDKVLELVYTENSGAAFGILQGKQILFYILTVVVLIVLLILLYKMEFNTHNIPYFIFLILIFSGAVGNFIDRVKNKFVVDFIYFKPIDFPVFNFADICITCGVILALIATLTIYRNE